jgi:O-antigen/teichoic acid export membrane protein
VTVNVGKNIWHVTLWTFLTSIFTYVFWFIGAKFAGPSAIGTASYMGSLILIISTIDVLDISLGMKRSLGLAISEGDASKYKQVLISSLFFVSLIVGVAIIVILAPGLDLIHMLKISDKYTMIFVIMVIILPFQTIFTESLIAASRSKDLIYPLIIGSLARFPVFISILYIFDEPTLSIIVGYFSMWYITAGLYGYYTFKVFRHSSESAFKNLTTNMRHVLQAGLSSWVPHTVYVLGAQLGVVTVVASAGESEGGKFYLAMGIYLVTMFIVMGITKVTHSSISGLGKEKEQTSFLLYSIKIAYILTMPISVPIFYFSGKFLAIMGQEFRSSGPALSILIIGLPLAMISEMIYYFMYGRAEHRVVLFLGLAGNIPRVILYFILPIYIGINGAALAYVVGSLCQMTLSVVIGNRYRIAMEFSRYALITAVPFLIGLPLFLFSIQFIVSSLIIFFGSLLIYIKIGILTEADIMNFVYMVFSRRTGDKIYSIVSVILKKIT